MIIYGKSEIDSRIIKYDIFQIDRIQTKGERSTENNSVEVRALCTMTFLDGHSSDALLRKNLFNNKISPDDWFKIEGFIEEFIRFRKISYDLIDNKYFKEIECFYNSLSDENKLLLEVYE